VESIKRIPVQSPNPKLFKLGKKRQHTFRVKLCHSIVTDCFLGTCHINEYKHILSKNP
jgi:hypothetical protein